MLPPLPECLAGQLTAWHATSAAARARGEEKEGRVKLTSRVALVIRCLCLRLAGYRVHRDRRSAFLVIDGGRRGPTAGCRRRARTSSRQEPPPPSDSAA